MPWRPSRKSPRLSKIIRTTTCSWKAGLRASSVVQVLQNDFGIDPKRLTAAGRGEFNPIADNGTELGKQRNRRTEIIITPKLDEFLDLIDQAPEDAEK